MRISNDECFYEYYSVISYSHAKNYREKFEKELDELEKNNVCYWFDEEGQISEDYYKEFIDKLDNPNCKCIIFFITEPFLLSEPCIKEAEYFYNNYIKNENKKETACLFILPEHFLYFIDERNTEKAELLHDNLMEYKIKNPDNDIFYNKISEETVRKNIDLFLKLMIDGKRRSGTIGQKGFIDDCCSKGQIFDKAGITFGHRKYEPIEFGWFPQNEKRVYRDSKEEKSKEERPFDRKLAHYAPIEWLILKESKDTQIYLSKKLLFAIDYSSLKYPINNNDNIHDYIYNYIKLYFLNYFEPEEEKKRIIDVRFLREEELMYQINRANAKKDMVKKNEILLPEPTFFAKITERENAYSFWLAGEMDNARRVDTGIEGLSPEPAGVELYYVRVVIEVEKQP